MPLKMSKDIRADEGARKPDVHHTDNNQQQAMTSHSKSNRHARPVEGDIEQVRDEKHRNTILQLEEEMQILVAASSYISCSHSGRSVGSACDDIASLL